MFNHKAVIWDAVKELSDLPFQQKVWVNKEGDEISSFEECVSALYNDTGLLENLQNKKIVFDKNIDEKLLKLYATLGKIKKTSQADIVASAEMRAVRAEAVEILKAFPKKQSKKKLDVPPKFNEEFLEWFKGATETAWASYAGGSFEEMARNRNLGTDWQQGTRWTQGLSDAEISSIEKKWALTFPPDYKLFLKKLHATTPRQEGARLEGDDIVKSKSRAGFYNWLTEEKEIQEALDAVTSGILFDIKHNNFWIKSWGVKPASLEAQKKVFMDAFQKAPKLAPLFKHRFLFLHTQNPGNPVLSLYQADAIVYGADLREYLINEFSDLLNIETQWTDVRQVEKIPFWGELIFKSTQQK